MYLTQYFCIDSEFGTHLYTTMYRLAGRRRNLGTQLNFKKGKLSPSRPFYYYM
jgi:hypothetical protein